MSETSALSGGCLCGRVRFEARPDKREGYYCHCRMCQMAVGNTRAAFINLRKDQVTWTGVVTTYYASSKIARRGFCANCGTPLRNGVDQGAKRSRSSGYGEHLQR
jgi:hypothetical protein